MAKVYKVEMYISDFNSEIEDAKEFIEDLLDNGWIGVKVADVKESEEFEWDDDLAINKVKATKEDYEEYFPESINYKHKCQAFVGEDIEDFFCNGFFGSDTYDLRGARIEGIFENDDEIKIEVLKLNDEVDYGYFDGGWKDWKTVYEHLNEWVNILE